jgi:hypothetical protein
MARRVRRRRGGTTQSSEASACVCARRARRLHAHAARMSRAVLTLSRRVLLPLPLLPATRHRLHVTAACRRCSLRLAAGFTPLLCVCGRRCSLRPTARRRRLRAARCCVSPLRAADYNYRFLCTPKWPYPWMCGDKARVRAALSFRTATAFVAQRSGAEGSRHVCVGTWHARGGREARGAAAHRAVRLLASVLPRHPRRLCRDGARGAPHAASPSTRRFPCPPPPPSGARTRARTATKTHARAPRLRALAICCRSQRAAAPPTSLAACRAPPTQSVTGRSPPTFFGTEEKMAILPSASACCMACRHT